ncbi:hypothetical protein BDD12DRAFT_15158 [Trichophaea hybrida]|nr:hypothetical protein BDD12DRAFT_15158 [Trichophaea hybrida]
MSHTPCTPHTEIPSTSISEEIINDAALLLQLQQPPPENSLPQFWGLDMTTTSHSMDFTPLSSSWPSYPDPISRHIPLNHPRKAHIESTSRSPNYTFSPARALTEVSEWDELSYSVRDEPPNSWPNDFYTYQFSSGNPKYAVHSGTLSSSSLPTEHKIDERRQAGDLCELCGGYFKLLSRHMRTKHPDTDILRSKLFVCPEPDCPRNQKGFSRKDNLTQHRRLVHGTSVPKRNRLRGLARSAC